MIETSRVYSVSMRPVSRAADPVFSDGDGLDLKSVDEWEFCDFKSSLSPTLDTKRSNDLGVA